MRACMHVCVCSCICLRVVYVCEVARFPSLWTFSVVTVQLSRVLVNTWLLNVQLCTCIYILAFRSFFIMKSIQFVFITTQRLIIDSFFFFFSFLFYWCHLLLILLFFQLEIHVIVKVTCQFFALYTILVQVWISEWRCASIKDVKLKRFNFVTELSSVVHVETGASWFLVCWQNGV